MREHLAHGLGIDGEQVVAREHGRLEGGQEVDGDERAQAVLVGHRLVEDMEGRADGDEVAGRLAAAAAAAHGVDKLGQDARLGQVVEQERLIVDEEHERLTQLLDDALVDVLGSRAVIEPLLEQLDEELLGLAQHPARIGDKEAQVDARHDQLVLRYRARVERRARVRHILDAEVLQVLQNGPLVFADARRRLTSVEALGHARQGRAHAFARLRVPDELGCLVGALEGGTRRLAVLAHGVHEQRRHEALQHKADARSGQLVADELGERVGGATPRLVVRLVGEYVEQVEDAAARHHLLDDGAVRAQRVHAAQCL